MRLRNRNHNIPGGFKFTQAETSFEAPANLSFNGVVDAVVKHRLGNPYVSKKHNLATDWESVAIDVENFNALRMQSNPKFSHFIIDEEIGASSFSGPFSHFPRASQLVGAVAAVRKTVAGVGVLLRWLGNSGRSVTKPLAERRASICAGCPKNQKGDWKTWFTEEASREILLVFGIMQDLKLSTSKDEELGVCSACLCPLKSKVHAELKHIAAELKPEVKAELNQENPRCWILSELEQAVTKQ